MTLSDANARVLDRCLELCTGFLVNVNVHVRYMSSHVRLSSVTFVHPTQVIEIFHNVFTPFGALATY